MLSYVGVLLLISLSLTIVPFRGRGTARAILDPLEARRLLAQVM